jgi:hypothetical protein
VLAATLFRSATPALQEKVEEISALKVHAGMATLAVERDMLRTRAGVVTALANAEEKLAHHIAMCEKLTEEEEGGVLMGWGKDPGAIDISQVPDAIGEEIPLPVESWVCSDDEHDGREVSLPVEDLDDDEEEVNGSWFTGLVCSICDQDMIRDDCPHLHSPADELVCLTCKQDHRDEEISLPEEDLVLSEYLDSDGEKDWVYAIDEHVDYEELRIHFPTSLPNDEPTITVDARGWTGFKSVVESFKQATGEDSLPGKAKGGIQQLLIRTISQLCKQGMLLVIENADKGDSDVVCQLLQIMEGVFEDLGDDIGVVFCLLQGWTATEIAGPDLDDASETVCFPVGYVDELQWVGC